MNNVNKAIAQRGARFVLANLVDLHVPASVEYLCGNVVISVPSMFAKVLHETVEKVEQALADGVPVGAY